METIVLIILVDFANGLFLKNGRQISIPPKKIISDIIKNNKQGLRAENVEDEAKLDMQELLKALKDTEGNLQITEDTPENDATEAIVNTLGKFTNEIATNINNSNDGNALFYEELGDGSTETNDGETPKSLHLGIPSDSMEQSKRYIIGRLHLNLVPARHITNRKCQYRCKKSATQAGYTQNPDTCQTYNDNLQKLWNTLSIHLNISDTPSERALHNIAIIIRSYLEHEHSNSEPKSTKAVFWEKEETDPFDHIITKIHHLITEPNPLTITKNIYELITKEIELNSNYEECNNINKENLHNSLELAYQNYLENADCRKDGASKDLRSEPDNDHTPNNNPYNELGDMPSTGSMKLKDSSLFKGYRDLSRRNNPDKELMDQFAKIKSKPSLKSEISKLQKLKKIVVDLYGDYIEETPASVDDPFKLLSVANFLKFNLLKRTLRSNCEEYARRTFLHMIRSIIEQYLSSSKCQVDATLRTRNHKPLGNKRFNTNKNAFSKNMFPLVSNFKTPISNIKNNYNNQNKNPIHNFYGRNYNQEKLQDVVLSLNINDSVTPYYVPRPVKYGIKLSVPDNLDNLPPNLYGSQVKTYNTQANKKLDDVFYSEYSSNYGNNTIPIKQNTLDDANFDRNQEDDNNINLHKMHYEDFFQKMAQQNLEGNVKDRLLDLLNYTNRNRETLNELSSIYDSSVFNKRFKKIAKRSKNSRTFEEYDNVTPNNNYTGYVELTHKIPNPKSIKYRPQVLIKTKLPYDEYNKNKHNFENNNGLQLLKAVRYFPDDSYEVLIDNAHYEPELETSDDKNSDKNVISKPVVISISQPSLFKGKWVVLSDDDFVYFGNTQHNINIVFPSDNCKCCALL